MTELIENWICKNVDRIESGDIDSIPFFLELRNVKKLIEDTLNQISENVLSDLSGQPKEINGFKIEPQNGRAMYNFKHIPEWVDLQRQIKEVENRSKIALSNMIIDENTGEVVAPAIVTYSKDTIKVSNKK